VQRREREHAIERERGTERDRGEGVAEAQRRRSGEEEGFAKFEP